MPENPEPQGQEDADEFVQNSPGFSFAEPAPWAKPARKEQPLKTRKRDPQPRKRDQPTFIPPWDEESTKILQEDWTRAYEECPDFGELWEDTHDPKAKEWPKGYKVFRDKLLYQEKLCVPTNKVWTVLKAHHIWNAHQSGERLGADIYTKYELPALVDTMATIAKIKRHCLVCQACQAPTWSMKQPIVMTPIPPRVMMAVGIDVFSMPETTWQGETYDAILLCVDRHSGWMIARPTTKSGLTGERAAHLLIDSGWGEMAIPSIITSDQGAQFVSQWWETMCARLGIRQAYSQAHRPQANGRAEVAGRVLLDTLAKLHAETQNGWINWVEALPRALRIHHDAMDPVTGMSPYRAIFGRDRNLANLPWLPKTENEEAHEFFDRVAEIDQRVAYALERAHAIRQNQVNKRRRNRTPLEPGQWIWVIRPKKVGGPRLTTRWQGPYKIFARVGEHSYQLKASNGDVFDVHMDQLKNCFYDTLGEIIFKRGLPKEDTDSTREHEEYTLQGDEQEPQDLGDEKGDLEELFPPEMVEEGQDESGGEDDDEDL